MANKILVKNGKILSTNNEILVSNIKVPEGELSIDENGEYKPKYYTYIETDREIEERINL